MTVEEIRDGAFDEVKEEELKQTVTEIRDKIFDNLKEEFKLTIAEIKDMDYINYGWAFRFKEIKGWLFALWITEEGDNYEISFFGERGVWIDRFNPKCCHINTTIRVSKEWSVIPDHWVSNQYDVLLQGLRNERKYTEYIMSDDLSSGGYTSWRIKDFWKYTIKTSIEKWFLPIITKSIAYYWQLKYHKYLKIKRIYHKDNFSLPKLDVDIVYKKHLPIKEFNIPYFGIAHSKLAKFLDKHHVCIHHIEYFL